MGLGIMFIDLTRKDKAKLQRLVDGIRDGSITQSIRRSIREGSGVLLHELRKRPADHKRCCVIAWPASFYGFTRLGAKPNAYRSGSRPMSSPRLESPANPRCA